MLGPADIEAWSEDLPPEPAPAARPNAAERAARRRNLLARLAHGRALTLAEWRELRVGLLMR